MKKIPLEILKLEDESYHLLVKVVVNETIEGKMIVDTGASRTVIDANLALEIDPTQELPYTSGIGGEVAVTFTKLTTLAFSEFKVKQLSLEMIDLQGVNQVYEKVTQQKIIGLLGSDLLSKYRAKIDYKKSSMYLEY